METLTWFCICSAKCFIWSEYVQVILSIFGIEIVIVVHQWWKQWIFFFNSVIIFLLQERPQRKIWFNCLWSEPSCPSEVLEPPKRKCKGEGGIQMDVFRLVQQMLLFCNEQEQRIFPCHPVTVCHAWGRGLCMYCSDICRIDIRHSLWLASDPKECKWKRAGALVSFLWAGDGRMLSALNIDVCHHYFVPSRSVVK